MSNAIGQVSKPWYRELWPWLLMIPPGASVFGGFTMVYLAVHEPNVLVVDDYARIEEITRARFARDARAAELGLEALIRVATDADGRAVVEVALDGNDGFAPPARLSLYLRHAANAAGDRKLELARDESIYLGVTDLAAGRYEVEVVPSDESWRLGGLFYEDRGFEGPVRLSLSPEGAP
jgi:uncharacterized protein